MLFVEAAWERGEYVTAGEAGEGGQAICHVWGWAAGGMQAYQ